MWTALPADKIALAVNAARAAADVDQRMIIRAADVMGGPTSADPGSPFVLNKPKFTFTHEDGTMLACFTADSAVQAEARGTVGSWRLKGGRLFFPSDLAPADMPLRQSSRWLDYMSISELTNLLKLARVTDPAAAVLTKQVRITEPLNSLVMLLIGVPFILSRERNVKASAVRCLLMVVTFYAFVYLSRYVGLSPVWAAWLPVLVFGPVAALMLDAVKT